MLLVPGAVVIFDDFSMATHVFRAFADYKAAFMRSAHPVAMTSDYAAQVAFAWTECIPDYTKHGCYAGKWAGEMIGCWLSHRPLQGAAWLLFCYE